MIRHPKTKEILEAYQRGDLLVDIAKTFDYPFNSIGAMAKRNGIPLRRTNLKKTEIIKLREQGKTCEQIAEYTGFRLKYVRDVCDRVGL